MCTMKLVNTYPCEHINGSLPQVSATEMPGDLGGRLRLGLRSEWLRRMKGRGPRTDTGNLARLPKGRGRKDTPVDDHA